MPVDISHTPNIRLNPTQELKLTKPDTELYVGQILKAVIVKSLSENQVLININGENINALTSQHIDPGDILQVRVLKNDEETVVLQVLRESPPLTPMEAALAKTLPKQAPATHLFASLHEFENLTNLPANVKQQINQFLASITSINQLPQQLAQAIANSGLFWEAALLNWRKNGANNTNIQNDFKGQCLRLLDTLLKEGAKTAESARNHSSPLLPAQRENLPLPGAIPQPLAQLPNQSLAELPEQTLLNILCEQTEQVLARIKTSQLTNLLKPADQPISLMLDLPLRTETGFVVIPLLIKEYRQDTPPSSSSWSITFAVNLTDLGDIQAKIKLQNMAIDVQINAERQETLALLEANQHAFDMLLTNIGLTLRLWSLHLGLDDQDIDTCNLRLLDIRI